MSDSEKSFHTKYRPKTLGKLLGHEQAVARLTGIVATKKYPNALLFTGPTSSGKTTIARAFAADVNEVPCIDGHADFLEINAATTRGIDDVRNVLEVAKLMPMRGKKRFILIDEAQQLTGAAAQAMLKTLEEPPKHTIFILCSMEPEKFSTGTGKAIANRCSPFVLQAPTAATIGKYLMRIVKREEIEYATKPILKQIIDNCNGEMRTAANLLEALVQYASSLDDASSLSKEDIALVLKSVESADDEVAVRILVGVYARKFSVVQRAILDIAEPFGIMNKLVYLNAFMLNQHVLKGEQHKAVWFSKWNKALLEASSELGSRDPAFEKSKLAVYAATNSALVKMKAQAMNFTLPEAALLSSSCFDLVRQLQGMGKD